MLRCVARTALRTKLYEKLADQLTDIVVDAVLTIKKPDQPIDLYMVRVVGGGRGGERMWWVGRQAVASGIDHRAAGSGWLLHCVPCMQ